MSQYIQKLKNGNVIKAQEGDTAPEATPEVTSTATPKKYGHLIIDGIDLGNSPEMIKAFAEHGKRQGLRQGKFYDRFINMLNNGEDVVFGLGNTVNDTGGFSERRAKERSWANKVLGNAFNTDREQFSNAIYTARQFSWAPKPVDKTKHNNDSTSFDFDGKGDAAVYSQNNPGNLAISSRINPYLDWLQNESWGTNNEFRTALTADQESALRAWYNQLEGDTPEAKRQAALDYWNAQLSQVQGTRGGYDNIPEAVRDFFNYFNVGAPVKPKTTEEDPKDAESEPPAYIDDKGKVVKGAKDSSGRYYVFTGDGSNGTVKGATYTTFDAGDKPYLLNSDRLDLFGLNDSWNNAIVYGNRIYKPSEVSGNVNLSRAMQQVRALNNSARSASDLYTNLADVINWTDYENPYADYNSDVQYLNNAAIRQYLADNGIQYAGLFNPTAGYTVPDGTSIYGIYNFNQTSSSNPWGFRQPFYLVIGPDGTLQYSTSGSPRFDQLPYQTRDAIWDPMTTPTNWQDLGDGRGNYYGLYTTVQGSDMYQGKPTSYQIFEGRDGNFYHKKNNGTVVILPSELIAQINAGYKPTRADMEGNHESTTPSTKKHPYEGRISRKEGGVIEIQRIQRMQGGNRFAQAAKPAEEVKIQDSPLQHSGNISSNVWDSLSDADQKEILAAATDVAGAIAGLIPGGSIAGAVSGIGVSTPLMLSAARDRKGHLDLSDWGQAAIATGLDLVSLIPYLGETGKVVKIGKAVSKVAVPLGKAFGALGLVEAGSVLTKNPKNWNTDDLLKLSAGIQAVIGFGHRQHVAHGERKLAGALQAQAGGGERKFTKTFGTGDSAKKIELTTDDISRITSAKDAEKELSTILKGKGVADEMLQDPRGLLSEFGFEVKQRKAVLKKNRTTVAETPEETDYSKRIGIDLLGKKERARREYIDKMLRNSDTHERFVTGNEEAFTRVRSDGKITYESNDNYIGRAYRQARARINPNDPDITTSWFHRIQVNPIERQGERGPESPLMLPEWVRQGRPYVAPRTVTGTTLESGPTIYQGNSPLGLPEASPRSVTPRSPFREIQSFELPTSETRQLPKSNWSDLSNSDFILRFKSDDVSVDSAVTLLRELPEARQKKIIAALTKENSNKAKSIVNQFNVSNRIKSNKSSKKVGSSTVAKNIEELRNSKDPMATLRKLSNSSNFAQQTSQDRQGFIDAYNEAVTRAIATMSPEQRRSYFKELSELRGNYFKNGGKLNNDIISIFDSVMNPKVEKAKNGTVLKAQDGNTAPYGGGSVDSRPFLTSAIKWGLGALDYGAMAWGRKKVHDEMEKGIKESIYKGITPQLAGVSVNTPTEDAAVRRYDEYVSRGLTTPLTSDNVANTQNVLTLQANALQGRDQAVRQQSAARLQREQMNQQIHNQQLQLDAANENDFRARVASARMNIRQNNASLAYQTAQSLQNLGRELRTDFNTESDKFRQFAYESELSDKTTAANNAWLGWVRNNNPDAWKAWDELDSTAKGKYGNDFTTWAQQSTFWDSLKDEYEKNRAGLRETQLDLYMIHRLPWELGWMGRKQYATENQKKGGTLNGKTRYKHEPDEEIWINQNKATHRAVAKLNDNIIKTFLKTLK